MLEIAAAHYEIYVPYLVLQEVEQLNEDKAVKRGLNLYEETTELIAMHKSSKEKRNF